MGSYPNYGRQQPDDTKFCDEKHLFCKTDSTSIFNIFRNHEPKSEGTLHRRAADAKV